MINFKIKQGSRRIVFLVGNRVYKIPSFRRWVSFIRGIMENLEERYWYSADGSRKRDPNRLWNPGLPIAEIFWADRFGFLVVMERLNTDFMQDDDLHIRPERLPKLDHDLCQLIEACKGYTFYKDISARNVGYRGDRLLVLDYGYAGGTMDCYIGT